MVVVLFGLPARASEKSVIANCSARRIEMMVDFGRRDEREHLTVLASPNCVRLIVDISVG